MVIAATKYHAVVTALKHKQVVTKFDVASAALLVYDYSLTFGEEYTLVWPAKWRLGKFLFLFTRYLPFIDTSIVIYHNLQPHIDVQACMLAYKATGWTFVFGIGIAEVILIVRTCAIWNNGGRIMIGLGVFFVAIWTPICVLLNMFLDTLTFAPPPFPEVPGCFLTGGRNSIIFWAFLLVMVFETGILALTLFKGIDLWRHGKAPRLISTLYKDGISCYVYLFVLSVVNFFVLLELSQDYATLLSSMQRVMHSLLTARILLHLRGASSRSNQTISLETIDITKRSDNTESTEGDTFIAEGDGWFERGSLTPHVQDIERGYSGMPRRRRKTVLQ